MAHVSRPGDLGEQAPHIDCNVLQSHYPVDMSVRVPWSLVLLITVACFCKEGFCEDQRRPGEELFKSSQIPLFEIDIDEAAFRILNETNRTYVRGTFKGMGHVLEKVGFRLKGRSTFQPLDRKPSLTVKFNQFADQTYMGLTKIMLNNSVADESYLREYLANQLFREAGVPAPRTTHARVKLNGRDLGLYVVVEGITKRFLQQHFSRTDGNLYEGGFRDVHQRLEQDGGSDSSQGDVKALWAAAQVRDPQERWQQLSEVLDVGRFTTFLAMEHLTGQRDGYDGQANNYRIYHDPQSRRMIVMPHGLDRTFCDSAFSLALSPEKALSKGVLSTHEGRKLYRQKVEMLFTNLLRASSLTNRLETAANRVYTSSGAMKEVVRSNYISLCQLIIHRSSNIAEKLRLPELRPSEFDERGVSVISGWQATADPSLLAQEISASGRAILQMQSTQNLGQAAFRRRVLLERGKYVLQGEFRIAKVEIPKDSHLSPAALLQQQTPASGVLFHAVGKSKAEFLTASSSWTELSREFEVDYGPEEVELACELRLCKGEVWIRADTLRLIRR